MPLSQPFSMQVFAFVDGCPSTRAVLKAEPQDFRVTEEIAYPLSGEGEHFWLWVEKTGQNTDWVAKQLAKWAGVEARAVGTAGKKDRQAVTCQWMSVHLPGKEAPPLESLSVPGVRVLKAVRHHRKLQTGGLSGNRFELVLRDVSGSSAEVEARLARIAREGVPNYFGEQRFGRDGQNLANATRWFETGRKVKRTQKSMYLSAVRSWLFNEILSHRVANGTWNQALSGDVFQLQGSQKWFVDDGDARLAQRVAEGDVHPTGALSGRGDLPSQAQVADTEKAVLAAHPVWQQGLEQWGLRQDRRALRVLPQEVRWQWLEQDVLQLGFSLPAGSYATMVVRELVALEQETAPAENGENIRQ